MKELTINIKNDFNRYVGGREKKIAEFSGEDFRMRFLEGAIDIYDRINIELDGVLGYPWDFLDEVFGVLARKHGKEKILEKINLVSQNNYVTEKIIYIVTHSGKEG
ncbi:MAG: STAS-like domain-containing protein [Desulfobacteraceae bacterium]|nr:STAS-like domain-containing protein [Desulfobacteraceae bacterium]